MTASPLPPADAPSAVIRPVPSGIGGGLFLFGVLAMLVTPVALVDGIGKMVVLYGDTLAALRGHLLFAIAYAVLMAGLAFYAGFNVFSGSPNGRTAATIFFVANIVCSFLLYMTIPGDLSQEIRAPLEQDHLRRIPIPLLWLLYFRLSRRCSYTYAPEYRHLPIRKKPLSRLTRGLLITWGALVFLGAAGLAVVGTQAAASRVASLPGSVTMDIGGAAVTVPAPGALRVHQEQDIITDDVVLRHYFVAETPHGLAEFGAGYFAGENEDNWDAIKFTYFKNDLRNATLDSGDKTAQVSEDRRYIVIRSQAEQVIGGRMTRVTLAEGYVLLNRRIARFTVAATADNPKVVENIVPIATQWITDISEANAAP